MAMYNFIFMFHGAKFCGGAVNVFEQLGCAAGEKFAEHGLCIT
jgi:hypothetical protein